MTYPANTVRRRIIVRAPEPTPNYRLLYMEKRLDLAVLSRKDPFLLSIAEAELKRAKEYAEYPAVYEDALECLEAALRAMEV